jgi:hypothetical protein
MRSRNHQRLTLIDVKINVGWCLFGIAAIITALTALLRPLDSQPAEPAHAASGASQVSLDVSQKFAHPPCHT